MSIDARGHYLLDDYLKEYGYLNRDPDQRSLHGGIDLMSPHPIRDLSRFFPNREGALSNLLEVASAVRPDGSYQWSPRINELARAYRVLRETNSQYRTNLLAMLIREMMGTEAGRSLGDPRTKEIFRTRPGDRPSTLMSLGLAGALENDPSAGNTIGAGMPDSLLERIARIYRNNQDAEERGDVFREVRDLQEAQGKDVAQLLYEHETPGDLIREVNESVQGHPAYGNPDRRFAYLNPSVREGGVFRANALTHLGTSKENLFAGTGRGLERNVAANIASSAIDGGHYPFSSHNAAGQQTKGALPFRHMLRGLGPNDLEINSGLTKLGRAFVGLVNANPDVPPESLYLRLLQGGGRWKSYVRRLPGNYDIVSSNLRDDRGRREVNVPPPPPPVQGPEGVDAQSMGLARRKAFNAPDIEGDVDPSQLRAPLEGPFIQGPMFSSLDRFIPPSKEVLTGDPSSESTQRQEDMARGGTGVQTFPDTSPIYPELPAPRLSREDLNRTREPAGSFQGRTPNVKGSPAKAVLFSNLSEAGSDLLDDMGANPELIEAFKAQDPDGQARTLQAFFNDKLDEIANQGAQEEGGSRSRSGSPVRLYRRRYEDAYNQWMSLYDKTKETMQGRFSPLEPPPSTYQGPNPDKVLTWSERQRQDRYEKRPGYAFGNPGGRMSGSVEPLVTPDGKNSTKRSIALNSPDPKQATKASADLAEGSRRGTQSDRQKRATGDVLSLMGKGPVDPNSEYLVDDILRKFYSEKELNEASLKNVTGTYGERLDVSRRLTRKAAEVSSVNRFFADLYDPETDGLSSYQDARNQIRGIIEDPEMSPDAKRRAAHRVFMDTIGRSPFYKDVPTSIDEKGKLQRGGGDVPPRPNLRVVKQDPEGYRKFIDEASTRVAQDVAPPRGQAGAKRQQEGLLRRRLRANEQGPYSLQGQEEYRSGRLEDEAVTRLPGTLMDERTGILLKYFRKNATADGYVDLPKYAAERLKKTPKKLERLVRLARREKLILRIDGKPLLAANVVKPSPRTSGKLTEADTLRRINQADPGRNAKLPAFTGRMNDPNNVRAAFLHMVKGKEDRRGALVNLLRSIKKNPDELMIKLRKMGVQIWDPEVMLEVGVDIVRKAKKQGIRLTPSQKAGSPPAQGGGAKGGGPVIPRGR